MNLRNIILVTVIALCAVAAAARSDKSDPTVMTIAGKRVPLSEFSYLYHKNASQQAEPVTLDRYVEMFVDYKLKVADAEAAGIDTTEAFRKEFDGYRREIAATNPDYRNLLNEYRDGMLLFEISNREVWGRAATDTAAVNAWFDAHRERYAYNGTPRYKGYVIVAQDDSIADAAFRLLTFSTVKPDVYSEFLRNELGNGVRIERVLAAKGENPVIDCIVWGAPTPAASGRWKAWRAFGGRVIEAPETASDTAGAAVADYQAELEAAWLKRLRDTYPVKINRKALRSLR